MERFHSGRPVAEVFGITPLADRLAQRGPAGEELSGLLNAYLACERALFSTARSLPYHAVGVRLVCFLAIRYECDRRRAAVGGTMGVRKSVYVLAAAEVEALREAFLAVMGLRDERGYQYHAGVHGLPLPIQCRHGDILFLPWHRAYLYFFELALQDRVPEVAIPWWDWISASAHQDGLPPTHVAQVREEGRPNPLFDSEVLLPPAELELVRERLPGALTDDDPPRTRRGPDLPDELPRDRTIRSILGAPTFSDFSSRLENVHNDVHVWVGGSMSAVPVAGFDPVFWSHHAMIDRLWYLWQLTHPGSLPPAQTLDLALAPFPMTVRQTMDISVLGYEYAVQTS